MKQKIVVVIAVITVVGTIVASTAFIWQAQEQLNELRRQSEIADSVKIVDFSSPGWWNPVGVTVVADFNVTIMNSGTYNAEGLMVVVEGLDFQETSNNVTSIIESLPAGEKVTVQGTLYFGFNAFAEGSQSLIASLWVNGTIVDSCIIDLRQT